MRLFHSPRYFADLGAHIIAVLFIVAGILLATGGSIERLSGLNVQLQNALIAVDRLYQVLDLELEQVGAGKKVKFEGAHQGIDLHDVAFRYGCRANVLEKLNMTIPAGKTVAVTRGAIEDQELTKVAPAGTAQPTVMP